MSLYNGPARGGTRGGADQFSWDNVKSDKVLKKTSVLLCVRALLPCRTTTHTHNTTKIKH